MWFTKKQIYTVKRQIVTIDWEIDENGDTKTLEKVFNLPDAYFWERNDCKLIFSLIQDAKQLESLMLSCHLQYPKIFSKSDVEIDFTKIIRDHLRLNHWFCPKTV